MNGKKQGHEGIAGCLAFALLAFGLMPIFGAYFLFKKKASDGERFMGFCFLVCGLVLWFMVALNT